MSDTDLIRVSSKLCRDFTRRTFSIDKTYSPLNNLLILGRTVDFRLNQLQQAAFVDQRWKPTLEVVSHPDRSPNARCVAVWQLRGLGSRRMHFARVELLFSRFG